jgi:hypothetical protein
MLPVHVDAPKKSRSSLLNVLHQVDELRSAGVCEVQRRRSLEATLKQAAGLFRKELATKSDEVSALQVGGGR